MIVNQVLDELGISLDHELSEVTPGLEKPHISQVGKVKGLLILKYSHQNYIVLASQSLFMKMRVN